MRALNIIGIVESYHIKPRGYADGHGVHPVHHKALETPVNDPLCRSISTIYRGGIFDDQQILLAVLTLSLPAFFSNDASKKDDPLVIEAAGSFHPNEKLPAGFGWSWNLSSHHRSSQQEG